MKIILAIINAVSWYMLDVFLIIKIVTSQIGDKDPLIALPSCGLVLITLIIAVKIDNLIEEG